jgi:hypothetical protein
VCALGVAPANKRLENSQTQDAQMARYARTYRARAAARPSSTVRQRGAACAQPLPAIYKTLAEVS